MTLIVGFKCSDGIVMGADGAATFGNLGQGIIRQPIKKLEIIGNYTILGISGKVGLGQMFKAELENSSNNNIWHKKDYLYFKGEIKKIRPNLPVILLLNNAADINFKIRFFFHFI